ncbi:Laccase domain protein yfiH [Rickettsiales bacterium Ac37b]|nr:Laccase domain protein yfiH [Rickettsiales bacterium Ac37b]
MYKITSSEFSKLSHISHAFFTRNIPSNSNIYIDKTSDNTLKPQIEHNKQIIASMFNQPSSNLCILKQVHGNKVITTNYVWPTGSEPEADAIITSTPNILLAIMTADCCPLLFADYNQNIIAAAHAGWRGAKEGILEHTVQDMLKLGAKLEDIKVVIGPCIHQNSYEIGPEFYQLFMDESKLNSQFFITSPKANYFKFDLPGYVTNKLQLLGINAISNINRNTFAETEHFFSYRRHTLSNDINDKGSLLSVITLK